VALDTPGENQARPESSRGAVLDPTDTFVRRHLGSSEGEVRQMLETLGIGSVEELVLETVPESIRRSDPLALDDLPERELGEAELLEILHQMAKKNRIFRSFLGLGYSGTLTPGVIQRNILENPGWYTQYTPYQAEIYTPVAGEVIEVNESVSDDPELLNEDPHGEGWLIKLRFSSASDLKDLM